MRIEHALILTAALLVSGCASYRAPRDFLPTVDQAPLAVHGGWATASLRTDGFVRRQVQGECVAVSADSVFLQPEDGPLRGLAWTELHRVRVEGYRADSGDLPSLTCWGVAQSAGLGWWALFGLPIWALTSAGLSWDLHKNARVEATAEQWESLRLWCRFPQGMPPVHGKVEPSHTTLPGARLKGMPNRVDAAGQLYHPLPGVWLKGTFKPGQAPGQAPEEYLLTKIVAGLLVAVQPDSLVIWTDSLRILGRGQLRSAKLYRLEQPSQRLVKVGRIWNDGSLEAAPLAWFPQGLPDRSRPALEDSLRQELASWRTWLQRNARWLEP